MRRMLKFFTFSLAGILALATAQAARAQGFGIRTDSAPRVDVFGGYSFMRSNIVTTGTLFSLNGGSGSVVYNLSNWLGIVGDFGFYEQGNAAGLGKSLTLSSYQFGPRISLRDHSLVPFGQVLLGGGHATGFVSTTRICSSFSRDPLIFRASPNSRPSVSGIPWPDSSKPCFYLGLPRHSGTSHGGDLSGSCC